MTPQCSVTLLLLLPLLAAEQEGARGEGSNFQPSRRPHDRGTTVFALEHNTRHVNIMLSYKEQPPACLLLLRLLKTSLLLWLVAVV
jgi:hypothetical protein